jgi:hypothetical protein
VETKSRLVFFFFKLKRGHTLAAVFLYDQVVTRLQRNEPQCNIFSFISKGLKIKTNNTTLLMKSIRCTVTSTDSYAN